MAIRIVTEYEPKEGPFACRRQYVRVYNEDGSEIKYISDIKIHMTPMKTTAVLTIVDVELDIEAEQNEDA